VNKQKALLIAYVRSRWWSTITV